MELSDLDEDTINNFSQLTIENMFPNHIYYPTQIELPESTIDVKMTDSKETNYHFLPKSKSFFFVKDVDIYDIKTFHNLLGVCGGSYLKIYNAEINDEILSFQVPKGNLFALAFSANNELTEIFCVFGGEEPVIRVVNIMEGNETSQLIGHRSEIYDLKFSPKEVGILLSSSKDCTVRLWNIMNGNQICIFGGPKSYLADVLSIDWHMTGELFVSSGVDNSVKIYSISKSIQSMIDLSKDNQKIKTILKHIPLYSCNEIHHDYIDCVRFNGNFVISKSVNGVIKEWLPMFNKEGHYFFLVNTYIYLCKEKLRIVKFEFVMERNMLFIANEFGKIFFFNTQAEKEKPKDEYHFTMDYTSVHDTKKEKLIRTIAYSENYNCIFAGNYQGDLMRIQIGDNGETSKTQMELRSDNHNNNIRQIE